LAGNYQREPATWGRAVCNRYLGGKSLPENQRRWGIGSRGVSGIEGGGRERGRRGGKGYRESKRKVGGIEGSGRGEHERGGRTWRSRDKNCGRGKEG